MMMNFLVTAHYSSTTGEAFHLQGRYFIEEQNSTQSADNIPRYKVITRTGIFHKTIQRDINFQGKLDSVHIISMDNQRMTLRGFISHKTYVSEETDSSDVEIVLRKIKQGEIEYKL
jgi:hypothetical protein